MVMAVATQLPQVRVRGPLGAEHRMLPFRKECVQERESAREREREKV